MINRKYKPCGFDGCDQCLYARGVCLKHYRILYTKPLKRTAIKRTAVRIKPRSNKESGRLKKYYAIRNEFLSLPENKHCKCGRDGCKRLATDVHHKKGKIGDLLFDTRFFLPTSRICHRWIEDHPQEAYQLGLSLYRNRVN